MASWLDISGLSGLSEKEAVEKLDEEGANEIPLTRRRSLFAVAWGLARQPMFLLLVGGGVIYLALGDVRESLMLLGFVFVVMGITFYQERKTERALEALRDLSSPRALVIRDGQEKRIAGLSLLPVLFKWPLILFPVHIAFLELIIDPACSVVFEAESEEEEVMRRPPRDPKEPLFDARTVGLSVMQGLSVLVIALAVFAIALLRGQGELDARALTFTTLIVANLGLILTNRSWSRTILATLKSPNGALWWVVGGALVFLAMALYVPGLRDLFRFSTLHAVDLAICLAAGVVSILWFEGFKLLARR